MKKVFLLIPAFLYIFASCTSTVFIRPTEIVKLSGDDSVNIKGSRGVASSPSYRKAIFLENGKVINSPGEFKSITVFTTAGKKYNIESPIIAEIENNNLKIGGANFSERVFEIQNVSRIGVSFYGSQYSDEKTDKNILKYVLGGTAVLFVVALLVGIIQFKKTLDDESKKSNYY